MLAGCMASRKSGIKMLFKSSHSSQAYMPSIHRLGVLKVHPKFAIDKALAFLEALNATKKAEFDHLFFSALMDANLQTVRNLAQ
jgi:hypothetical protein